MLLGCTVDATDAAKDPYMAAHMRLEVAKELNALKNAAYALGHTAGKGEVLAFIQRH